MGAVNFLPMLVFKRIYYKVKTRAVLSSLVEITADLSVVAIISR